MKKYFLLIAVALLTLSSCDGAKGNNGAASGQPGVEGLQSIYIRPQNSPISPHAIIAGNKLKFKAFATYANGDTLDVSNIVNWHSNQYAIVKVEPNVVESVGVVSVVKPEDTSVNITASIGDIPSNSYALQVITGSSQDLSVYTLDDALYTGVASQYNAIAYSRDGYQLLLTNGVNWGVTPNSSGSITPDGVFIPNGSITSGLVNASFPESTAQTSFKVNTTPITSVKIAHNGIPTNLAIGAPLSLGAMSSTSQNMTNSPSVSWASSDESVLHFTGNPGNFVAKQEGTAKVIMSYTSPIDNKVESDELDIKVSNIPLESILISPSSFTDLNNYHTLPTSYSFNFSVGVVDHDATIYTILGASGSLIHWTVTAGASIDPTTGVVTTGDSSHNNVTVTASLISKPSIKATYTFNVKEHQINSFEVNPANYHMNIGDSVAYGVLARYVNDSIINVDLPAPSRIKWSIVEGNAKAIIDPTGKLTALSTGTVKVKAQLVTNGKLDARDNTVTLTIN